MTCGHGFGSAMERRAVPSGSRRRASRHDRGTVTPLLDQINDLERSGKVEDWGGTSADWVDLESRVAGLRQEIYHATSLSEFQGVGRRSREILVDVDLVFTAEMIPGGAAPPKAGDAKARFDLVVQAKMAGPSHAELRKVMRAVWELTQKVTRGSGITRVDAFAAAQGPR